MGETWESADKADLGGDTAWEVDRQTHDETHG